MIITPPSDEPDVISFDEDGYNYDWIRWYMDCPPWKCACRLTNHGRNKQCADWKCKLPRPSSYVENVYRGA